MPSPLESRVLTLRWEGGDTNLLERLERAVALAEVDGNVGFDVISHDTVEIPVAVVVGYFNIRRCGGL